MKEITPQLEASEPQHRVNRFPHKRAIAAAAIVGLGLGTLANFAFDKKDDHTLDEAKHDAVAAMRSVHGAKDLLNCEITGAKPGPTVFYPASGEPKSPSVLVSYKLTDTDRAKSNPYLRDNGRTVNGEHMEVIWTQSLDVEHHLSGRGSAGGTMKNPNAFDGNNVAVMPVNDTHAFRGVRRTDVSVGIEGMQVVAADQSRNTSSPAFNESCGTMTLDVHKGHVDVLHVDTPAATK